jgi:hypothetical protein
MSMEDDEAFARMLQQQLLDEGRAMVVQEQHQTVDADAEMARRLQEMELAKPDGSSIPNNYPTRQQEEEEDARLARLLAESGGSFKDLNMQRKSATGNTAQVQASTLHLVRPATSPLSRRGRLSPFAERSSSHQSQDSNASSSHERRLTPPRRHHGLSPPRSTLENRRPPPQPLTDPWEERQRQLNQRHIQHDALSALDSASATANLGDRANPDSILAARGAILDVEDASNSKQNKSKGFISNLFRARSAPEDNTNDIFPKEVGDTRAVRSRGRSPKHFVFPSIAGVPSQSDKTSGSAVECPDPIPHNTVVAPQGPAPYTFSVSSNAPTLTAFTGGNPNSLSMFNETGETCAVCAHPVHNPLEALGKLYHRDCLRCIACHDVIDPNTLFASIKSNGLLQPMHRKCYNDFFGMQCTVCSQVVPAGRDGTVSFVKHPFFDTERMCPKHTSITTRRCTGCHRFEPENEPFADLNDADRCVCMSCCRSVIVDSQEAQPLWTKVVQFFEDNLKLPIWQDFREIPILVVGYNALNKQINNASNVHGVASQIMTRGLCLTEHESGRRFRMNRQRFDSDSSSFVASDVEERGFTYFQVPDANKRNPHSSVTAILCLSGLPRDLTASVLAHEATHAWIKLHPRHNFQKPIPPQVEEGVAQLVALLFLENGLNKPTPPDIKDVPGPTDAKLRQYFKFNIETEEHEIYGTGYRRAAKAYSHIGIEALMSHIVLYQNFPET